MIEWQCRKLAHLTTDGSHDTGLQIGREKLWRVGRHMLLQVPMWREQASECSSGWKGWSVKDLARRQNQIDEAWLISILPSAYSTNINKESDKIGVGWSWCKGNSDEKIRAGRLLKSKAARKVELYCFEGIVMKGEGVVLEPTYALRRDWMKIHPCCSGAMLPDLTECHKIRTRQMRNARKRRRNECWLHHMQYMFHK